MTKYLIFVLSILSLDTVGQTKLDTTKIKLKYNFQTQPAYFLDLVRIDLTKNYLDLTNIESIKVTKEAFVDGNTAKFGKVYITSKNKNHNWAPLADLKTTKPITGTTRPKVYIIDGILISDTSDVRIEISFIKSIHIINMEEIRGFYPQGPPKTIFIITTKHYKKQREKISRQK